MADDVECPFNEPVPAGRQTKVVPLEVRHELAELARQHREFNGKKFARDPSRRDASETFGNYLASSARITDRINEIEIKFLGRTNGVPSRVAYHPDWQYSVETAEMLAKERSQ